MEDKEIGTGKKERNENSRPHHVIRRAFITGGG